MTPNKPAGTARTSAGWTRWCLALAIALAATNARADVPGQVAYQGRLTKADGTTESRTVPMTFKLYESAEGGQPVWNEEHPRVALSDGHYVVYLGSLTPFTGVEFDGRERWLELTVDGSALVPRQKLVSVPYAVRAREAQALKGGAVDATSIAINGNVVIDGQGKLAGNARYVAGSGVSIDPNTRAISLATGCDRDQVLKWSGTAWICAEDGGASYGAGDGLQLSNGQFSIKSSCQANQILKWNGGSWACAADANETVVAGAGLTKTGSTLGLTAACAPNQILKWSGADWACAADGGNTYGAGNGLVLDGSAFGLMPCTTGQILKWNGSAWACSADGGNTYAAGSGLRLDGAAFGIMPCGAGEIVKFDGSAWTCAADLTGSYRLATGSGLEISASNAFSLRRDCDPGEILAWSGTSWTCAPDADTATSAGAGLTRSGNVLSITSCPAGQVLRHTGATWACSADVNAAGTGLEKVGNALQLKTSCADGELLKWNGSDWACATDANAAYRAQTGGGLVVGSGNQLSLLRSCGTDEVLSWDGTAWVCAADKDTTYLAGTGLALAGRTFSLTRSCAADEILKWSGSAWVCAADTAGTYTAGAGLTLSGGVFSLMASCTSGQILKWNGTWTCAADTDTTYSAGDGLSLSGTTLSLKTGCSAGQVLKWNGGQWACANDLDTSSSYTAGKGLQLTGTSFSLNLACASGEILKWDGTNWACAADANDAALTAGKGITIASGQVSVKSTGCTAGQTLTWNGTDWLCAAPVNDTRYYTKAQIDANSLSTFRDFTAVIPVRDAANCPVGWTAQALSTLIDQGTYAYFLANGGGLHLGGDDVSYGNEQVYAGWTTSSGISAICSKNYRTRGNPFVSLISLTKASPSIADCPSGHFFVNHANVRRNDGYAHFSSTDNGFFLGGISTWDYGSNSILNGYHARIFTNTNTGYCLRVMGVEEDPATKYGVYPVVLGAKNTATCPAGFDSFSWTNVRAGASYSYVSWTDSVMAIGWLESWYHGGENYAWTYTYNSTAQVEQYCLKYYAATGGRPRFVSRGLQFSNCAADEVTLSPADVIGTGTAYVQRTGFGAFIGGIYDWARQSLRDGWMSSSFTSSNIARYCFKVENAE